MKIDSPLISVEELARIIDDKNTFIFDASNANGSKERYQKEHIQGAIHVNLETELSAIEKNPKFGGRHPLPKPNIFAKVLSKKGLKPEHLVVIYDDNNGGIAAARFWWMLKAVGHQKVQVLNGGYEKAKSFKISIDDSIVALNETNYPISDWKLPIIDIDGVELASKNENALIIDVRHPERYAGNNEPIDIKAGHIPSAVNFYYFDNMTEDGFFKTPDELKEIYQNLIKNKEEIILHCGSGVTACHTILAMNYAELPFPKLYVGSWSEWSRRK